MEISNSDAPEAQRQCITLESKQEEEILKLPEGKDNINTTINAAKDDFSNASEEFALPTPLSGLKNVAKKGKTTEKSKNIVFKNVVEVTDMGPTEPEICNSNISASYQEPEWSGLCEENYTFDVLKNGSIIDSISLSKKPFYIFGRLPSCDITLEHPSLSRHHAVVQYATKASAAYEKGWYVYDLDSTHGTWVNKKKISPKVYHRLKVGYIVKFGGSSRLHILQGPEEDVEEESEMTVTEMKAQKEKLEKQAELLRQIEAQEERKRQEEEQHLLEDRGCSWGMGNPFHAQCPDSTQEERVLISHIRDKEGDDAVEPEEGENNFGSLVAENESLYIDDPKKALKGFYEREGCDLPDYQFTEVSIGKHKCRLDLPVDGPNGEELVAEAIVSGKRKDAVVACALEACRILDRLGLLRSSTHESRKRKQKKWEDDDYYDSDEDTFLDRTGTIEKKRVMRMKKAGKDEPETYDSLLEKYNAVIKQIQDIEIKLQKAKAESEAFASDELDELDAYMVSIKSGVMDTKTRIKLKGELIKLKGEEQKLRKLVNIVKPPTLPPLKPIVTSAITTPTAADIIARKLHSQQKQVKKANPVKTSQQIELKPDDYEEQDEDEDDRQNKQEERRNDSTEQSAKLAENIDDSQELIEKNPPKKLENSSSVKTIGPSLQSKTKTAEKSSTKSTHFQSTASALGSLKAAELKSSSNSNFGDVDPNYAMWLPPTEQAGDGRTSLNDKLGY